MSKMAVWHPLVSEPAPCLDPFGMRVEEEHFVLVLLPTANFGRCAWFSMSHTTTLDTWRKC
jgi:hypothetical protein